MIAIPYATAKLITVAPSTTKLLLVVEAIPYSRPIDQFLSSPTSVGQIEWSSLRPREPTSLIRYVGHLDKQTSEIRVAGFGGELWIMISRLTWSWPEAEVATHIATSLETLLAAEGQRADSNSFSARLFTQSRQEVA
jgi:hypothetical protein